MYIDDKSIGARFGVTRQTVWRWAKTDPAFPPAVRLSPGCTRWRLDQIEEWEAARMAAA